MRFAISLLTLICIAAVIGTVIGTVVKQGATANDYVNQFGPFRAQVRGRFRLTSIYSAWWFRLILALLVVSTSLCIARNNYTAWLHMRLMRGLRGRVSAWWALTGLVVTTFAFLGVNRFLSGLHSCGTL